MGPVALAGTRVAWFEESGGLTLKDSVVTATPARRVPVQLGAGFPPGEVLQGPVGDGRLIVFTYGFRCDEEDEEGCPPGKHTGDIVGATLWRTATRGECPSDDYSDSGHCARIASADGELAALAVDAGRIAARTDQGVRLLTASGGRLLRDLPVAKVRAAALSGNQLALRVPGAVEIYDTGSGELVKKYPAQAKARLADLEGDILVTAMGRIVTLRRISDGRSATIRARGWAHAQLEEPGLFVAGARRVTFTPLAGVQRMLGGAGS
jgi:hypothetical protein